jgi:hypothetical protein
MYATGKERKGKGLARTLQLLSFGFSLFSEDE